MSEKDLFVFDEEENDEDALVVCNEDESISFEEWQEEESKGQTIEELIDMIYEWGDSLESLSIDDLDEVTKEHLVSLLKEFNDSLTFTSKQVQHFLDSVKENEDNYE